MRTLHEITQIWLCRVLFVVAGVAPALAVLAWASIVQTPWHRSLYERRAADLLDTDAAFASIEFPRPGVTRIREFVLSDFQTDNRLVEIATLEVRPTEHGWTITGDDVRVDRDSVGELSEWIARALRCKGDIAGEQTRITLERVRFYDGGKWTDECRIVCDRLQTEHGARLNVSLVRAGDDVSRVALSVLYDRRDLQGNLRLVLDTAESALPCSWIPTFAAHVGPDCTFQGKLWARQPGNSHGWYVDALAGEFAGINLAQLTGSLGDGKIEGVATASIRGAIFDNARLIKVAGQIDAWQGSIPTDLLHRLAKRLELESTFDSHRAATRTDFERLAFAFALDADGLLIEGRAQTPSVVMASDHGALATTPACDAIPLTNVLRAVAPPDAPLVPFNSATPWLSELVPRETTRRR